MQIKSNDIPEYLKGKSAADIVNELRHIKLNEISKKKSPDYEGTLQDYIMHLEGILLFAVKDALCNCDRDIRIRELIDGIQDGPGDRAVAFLNMVLPYDNTNI